MKSQLQLIYYPFTHLYPSEYTFFRVAWRNARNPWQGPSNLEYKSPHHRKTTDRYGSAYFIFITKVMIEVTSASWWLIATTDPKKIILLQNFYWHISLPFLRFPVTILRSFWRCCILSFLLVIMECCIFGMYTCVNTAAVRTCHH